MKSQTNHIMGGRRNQKDLASRGGDLNPKSSPGLWKTVVFILLCEVLKQRELMEIILI